MSFWRKIIAKIKNEKSVSQLLHEKNEEKKSAIFGKHHNFNRGLTKSAHYFSRLFSSFSNKQTKVDDQVFDEMYDLLISFDVGHAVAQKVIDACRKEVQSCKITDREKIKQIMFDQLFSFYIHDTNVNVQLNYLPNRVNIFLVVGVNGVGKTSAIAKIANKFVKKQKRVLLIAGDTFRAAACEQLSQWAKKVGCDIFLPTVPRQDCASVIYQGISKGVNENYDVVICDTSGRQQNKKNLMAELNKVRGVISRFVPGSPHETLLVIDATTGQTGLKQAAVFHEATNVTGIVLTKLDSTSKGGIIFAIKEALNVYVKLVCFGEKLDDIAEFDLEQYLLGLIQFFNDDHFEASESAIN